MTTDPTVIAAETLDAPSGPMSGTSQSRITAVVVPQGDRWAISAFHVGAGLTPRPPRG